MKRSFEKISSIAEGAATGGAGVHRLQDTAASKRNSKGLVSSERAEWCLSSRGRRRLRLSVSGPSINSISVLASEVEEGGESANQLVLELVGHKTTLAKWLLRALKEYIDNSKGKTDDFSMCTPPPAAKQTATADETAMTQADTEDPISQYAEAMEHYENSEYREAFPLLMKAAEKGYAEAQYQLGFGYENGHFTDSYWRDKETWYNKAAEQGHAGAQYRLALCYARSSDLRLQWLKKAASQGEENAQTELGNHYYEGIGVSQNYEKAVDWFQKAAVHGNARAQNYLGVCYERGHGVPQNLAEAAKWFSKAADQDFAPAINNLGLYYLKTDCELAAKLFTRAAEQGQRDSQYNLGLLYVDGLECETDEGTPSKIVIIPKDAEKAIFWFKKATEEGHRETQYQLALCYKNCDDDYRAFHWFKEAATKGHIEAQLHQANCYLKGLGTPCNRKGAVRIYSKIADGDSTFSGYASCKLALCYYDGLGVPSSKARAKELLFMAAEKGYEKAMKLYKKICQ